MKKIALMVLCFVSIALLSTSCTKEEDKDFDQQLLLGICAIQAFSFLQKGQTRGSINIISSSKY